VLEDLAHDGDVGDEGDDRELLGLKGEHPVGHRRSLAGANSGTTPPGGDQVSRDETPRGWGAPQVPLCAHGGRPLRASRRAASASSASCDGEDWPRTPVRDGHPYAILQGLEHELFLSEGTAASGAVSETLRHVGYSVQDLDGVVSRLRALGYVDHLAPIIDKPWSRQIYLQCSSDRDFGHFKSRKIRSIGPAAHGWRLLDGEAESPAIAE
jgi:hypothetical protein